MDWPIKHVSPNEVEAEINKLNNNKTPGYDGISGRIAKCVLRKKLKKNFLNVYI